MADVTADASLRPARSRRQVPSSKLVDRSPDTRKQHGFDCSDPWRPVPFQAGCASTTMEVDPQQQSATEALNALEHSFLGQCGCVAWPGGFNPLGRPNCRLPGSEFEITELHGFDPYLSPERVAVHSSATQRPRLAHSLRGPHRVRDFIFRVRAEGDGHLHASGQHISGPEEGPKPILAPQSREMRAFTSRSGGSGLLDPSSAPPVQRLGWR